MNVKTERSFCTVTTVTRVSAARDRLLRSASATFYAEGIRGVGVDRIVSEAGVTRATFYRHFPSKDDLVVAYLQRIDEDVRQWCGPVPDDPVGARRLVRELTTGMTDQMCGDGFRGCPFINAAAEYAAPAHPVHAAVVRHRTWLLDTVTAALGVAGHPEPPEAGRRFMMLRDGAMVFSYLADPAGARATLLAAVEDLLAVALTDTPQPQPVVR